MGCELCWGSQLQILSPVFGENKLNSELWEFLIYSNMMQLNQSITDEGFDLCSLLNVYLALSLDILSRKKITQVLFSGLFADFSLEVKK